MCNTPQPPLDRALKYTSKESKEYTQIKYKMRAVADESRESGRLPSLDSTASTSISKIKIVKMSNSKMR